ncbi:MAG: putative bifunctional diguanylate cyclase/phosphodiesterase [Devosia sp.]
MRKLFDRQLEKATTDGQVDLAALERLVTAAYEEAEQDRARTDRSIGLMAGELTAFQAELEAEIEKRTAQLRQSQRKLRMQNTRFLTALENMSQGLAMFDQRQRLVICNRQYLEMYNLPRRLGRAGTPFAKILAGCIAANTWMGEDPEVYISERLSTIESGQSSTAAHRLNNGRVVTISHRPMPDGGWVTTHKDITELHSMQAELAHQAYHDTLTDLPNRNLLYQRLGLAFQTLGPGESLAVLCLDLDGFKPINDSMGHSSGDKLLRQVAARLRECAGEADMVGRMGGDEFAVLHAGGTAESAMALAKSILEAIKRPFDIDDHSVSVAISIGIALAPRDGRSIDDLLKKADLALYSVKKERRGGGRFFEPCMDKAISERRKMEQDLRRALANGEFELHYQPVVNLKSQTIAGFEALLRWRHPSDGMIPPGDFIPLAEELGLIVPIGEWVIREAFTEAARWPAGLRVAVNVSSMQFGRGNLIGVVMNALASSGLAHERVEIEITETVFLENSQTNLDILHQLHALGLKVALDDFGTGYSALSYLLAFPFDKIKIDGSFVRALANAEGAHTVLRSVADIGERMGMTTTAEGIETPQQLRNVHALGYTEAQGFLISRPLPREAVRRLLQQAYDTMPEAPLREQRKTAFGAAG